MLPVRQKMNVPVSEHGRNVWMPTGNVLRKRLRQRNDLLVLDDFLRLGAGSEMPDGLCTEISPDAYIFSIRPT